MLGTRLFLATDAELETPMNAAHAISAAISAPAKSRRLDELPIYFPLISKGCAFRTPSSGSSTFPMETESPRWAKEQRGAGLRRRLVVRRC